MCGIAGFYNAEGNYQQQKEKWASVLTSMHECLAHRGNDESGIYLSDMTGLPRALKYPRHCHRETADYTPKERKGIRDCIQWRII